MQDDTQKSEAMTEESQKKPRKLAPNLRGTRAKVGKAAPVSGLFCCVKCGTEVTLKKGKIVALCPTCKGLSFEIIAE
jgi:hypothetical protein